MTAPTSASPLTALKDPSLLKVQAYINGQWASSGSTFEVRDPATGRQQLSLLVHHMVVDEWSINLMMGELAQAYLARAAEVAWIR